MILPNTKVVAFLKQVLPSSFLYDLTPAILRSWNISKNLAVHQQLMKQTIPQYRKGLVDTELEKLAHKHFNVEEGTLKIEGGVRGNCNGSHLYTELLIEQKVIVTAATTDCPNKLPRPSKFRIESVANNPEFRQLDAFESNVIHANFSEKKVESLQFEKPLGIIIAHGPSKSEQPEFIIIQVPDRNYTHSIAEINLLAHYSKALNQGSNLDLTPVKPDKPSARLRLRPEVEVESDEKLSGEHEADDDDGGNSA